MRGDSQGPFVPQAHASILARAHNRRKFGAPRWLWLAAALIAAAVLIRNHF